MANGEPTSDSARQRGRNNQAQVSHPYHTLNPFTASVALSVWKKRSTHRTRSFDEIEPLRIPSYQPADLHGHPPANPANVAKPPHPTTLPSIKLPEPQAASASDPFASAQEPLDLNYYSPLVPGLWEYLWAFLVDVLPRQIYLFCLLRLPSLYFYRTDRIFQSAGLTLEEIKDMALKATAEDHQAFQRKMLNAGYYYDPQTPNLSPAYHRLKTAWEAYIDKLVMEWQTLNIISALLVPGVLTIFQIQGASDDPITRYIAFWSLLCALISILHGCLFLVRFSSMRKPYKAAEWALETQKSQNIFWNVWVMMAMPALWLAWSIVTFIFCIVLFLWRFGTDVPVDFKFTTGPHMELGFRIFICVILWIGILYSILAAITLMRYGGQMDEAWARRIETFITVFVPQPPFHQLQFDSGSPTIGASFHPLHTQSPPQLQIVTRHQPSPVWPGPQILPTHSQPVSPPWTYNVAEYVPPPPMHEPSPLSTPRPQFVPEPVQPQLSQRPPSPLHIPSPSPPRPRPTVQILEPFEPPVPIPRISQQTRQQEPSSQWYRPSASYSQTQSPWTHRRVHDLTLDRPASPRGRSHPSPSFTPPSPPRPPRLHRPNTPVQVQRPSTSASSHRQQRSPSLDIPFSPFHQTPDAHPGTQRTLQSISSSDRLNLTGDDGTSGQPQNMAPFPDTPPSPSSARVSAPRRARVSRRRRVAGGSDREAAGVGGHTDSH